MPPFQFMPDTAEDGAITRRALIRACAAITLAARDRQHSQAVLRRSWPHDEEAGRILKVAQSPTGTGDYPTITAMHVLPLLAPNTASARILALATAIDMTGISQVMLPTFPQSGVPAPPWVGEDQPFPVVNLSAQALTLGPTCKMLIGAGFTQELQAASADLAATIIGQALAIAAGRVLDAALLGGAAATAISPAGLTHGLVALTASTSKGVTGLGEDIASLAGAVGAVADADTMAIVTTPALAAQAKVLASPKFTTPIFSSAALAAGTVIALVPAALATGYSGTPSVDVSSTGDVHFANPGEPISDGSGVLAAPVVSLWQTASNVLRVRVYATWVALPGSVGFLTGAAW